MKHPLFRQFKNLYFYFFIWLIIAVLHAVALWNQNLTWHWAIRDSLVFNFVFAQLGLGFWYTCHFINLEKASLPKICVSHLGAAIFASLVWLSISYLILEHNFNMNIAYRAFVRETVFQRLILGVLYYFVIISFYYVYIFSANYKDQLLKEAELQTLVREAELKSLKFQINPHFLFNSLNSINSLTLTDPKRAGQMTTKLGDYLRVTLSNNEMQKNILADELESIRLYLDIEKVRFGDKIKFIEKIENNCLDKTVPTMILQPLFENAIKHGVYESLDTVTIRLVAKRNGSYLNLSVQNDFDTEASPHKCEGIGLKNIKSRLTKMYGKKDLLEVEKNKNVFKVTVFIPIEKS